MVQQELLWANVWNTEPNVAGHELLMTRLKCQLEDGSKVALSELDAENLVAHSGQQLSILLPCGHMQQYLYAMLRAMPDHKCLEASCRKCSQTVLGPGEMIALANRLNRTERTNFYWEEVDQMALDVRVQATAREIEASVDAVCYVLEDTLNGFEVPSSATPAALSLVSMVETQAVLHALQKELRNAGIVVRATPTRLLEGLEAEAIQTLENFTGDGDGEMAAFLPPGLLEFVSKWLTRTVNFLCGVQREVSENDVSDLSAQLGQVRMSDLKSRVARVFVKL